MNHRCPTSWICFVLILGVGIGIGIGIVAGIE